MTKNIAVIGAGIVGVSTSIALQRRGAKVTLLDRREPGRETSYGNTGVISRSSFTPFNNPSLLKKLPGFLTNRDPAFRYSPTHLIASAPWLIRFLSHATKEDTDRRTKALAALKAVAADTHLAWSKEAGLAAHYRDTGTLRLWRSEAVGEAKAEQALMARFGLDSEVLDRQGISGVEPGLKPIYRTGLWKKDTSTVDSPGDVVAGYAAMFAARGGGIEQAEVSAIAPAQAGWRVIANGETRSFDGVVVALGPWSADLLRPLGLSIPLNFERGYHQEFEPPTDGFLSRPALDVEGAFFLTPMKNGIRLTTGVDFAHRDAQSNFSQLNDAIPRAREALPFGDPVAMPWRGSRPTLPDSLPMIGAAPRHDNLWLAFGHQHIGFSTGPATGEAIAALISGEQPAFDVAPFAPSRFI